MVNTIEKAVELGRLTQKEALDATPEGMGLNADGVVDVGHFVKLVTQAAHRKAVQYALWGVVEWLKQQDYKKESAEWASWKTGPPPFFYNRNVSAYHWAYEELDSILQSTGILLPEELLESLRTVSSEN